MFLALVAGSTAWGAGADLWSALGTTAAAAALAAGCHDLVSTIARIALPVLVAIPRIGAPLAAVVRALLAPTAPTVSELQAERSKGAP